MMSLLQAKAADNPHQDPNVCVLTDRNKHQDRITNMHKSLHYTNKGNVF